MRAAALAAFLAPLAMLAGCGQSDQGGAGGDANQGKFAGLDGQILTWRKAILASDPLCKSQAEGEKCEGFEVACKAERALSADDQAKQVTARVVAVMTWTGFDPKFKHGQNGAQTVEFVKGASGWTRALHKPANPGTCADL
jgi:hypothetical protein